MSNDVEGKLRDVLQEFVALDKTFKDDLEASQSSVAHFSKVKDLLYSFHLHKEGSLQRSENPNILPGIVQDYWLKLKAYGLPFFQKKYEKFDSAWFFDLSGDYFKEGVSGDPYDIFILTEKETRECISSSYLHLPKPAVSQETLVKAFGYFFEAQKRFIDENQDKLNNIEQATEKKRKIDLAADGIKPIRKNLKRKYNREKLEKQHDKEERNPDFNNQVKASLGKYHSSHERSEWFEELKRTYFRIKESPDFCPTFEFYSSTVEFIFTEFLTETPLRPKGDMD